MPGWEDEPLGAFGSASQIPDNTWFPVDTTTGQWGTPTPTIGSTTGMLPSMTETPPPIRSYGEVPGQEAFFRNAFGPPDEAPLAIGQVAGTLAPMMTTPRSMQRVQRLDEMGALAEKPSMWSTIARAVGNLSPQGRAMLQYGDQQQQQQLQNRLTLRRQALQEEQNDRAEIRDDFNSLLKLSEIKSKKLRNLYTDRFIADMQARGKVLPPDFVEAFKTSSGDEAKAMVKFYEPLLTDLGLDPTAFAELVDQGGIKEVGDALSLAQKVKKDKTEQARLAALDAVSRGEPSTLGDVSGTATPTTGAGATATAPGTRQLTYAPTPEYTTAIDEAHKRYPQVRKELIPAIIASESNFDSKAVSPKGAQGPMQLMPAAQQEMGVTDPFDVTQNVRGGTGYYAKMLERYKGNEALALAAYNWGPGNVDNVGGDLSKMPAETQSYVKTTLQRASGGGGGGAPAATGTATAAGGTPQEQAQMAALNTRIDVLKKQVQDYARIGGEEGNKRADNARSDMNILIQQRNRIEDRLTKAQETEQEGQRALHKQQLLEPGRLREQEAGRALTPISDVTQKSLATNKSIYRSIGKVEEYLREGTDLPADFVNLVAQDTPGISAWLESDPKNITGLAKQWETKFKAATANDPRANRFLSALGNMRDLVIRERSGGSVTGNELDRAMGAFMGSLPNINQAFSLFAQNLANVKETVLDELVTSGAAARPLSGGKAMYGTLPKEVRDRIDYAERGEDYPKAKMPGASPGEITLVAPPAWGAPPGMKPPNASGGHPVGVVRPGPVLP